MQGSLWSGEIEIEDSILDRIKEAIPIAEDICMAGMIAAYLAPSKVKPIVSNTPDLVKSYYLNPKVCKASFLTRELKGGTKSRLAGIHLRNIA